MNLLETIEIREVRFSFAIIDLIMVAGQPAYTLRPFKFVMCTKCTFEFPSRTAKFFGRSAPLSLSLSL